MAEENNDRYRSRLASTKRHAEARPLPYTKHPMNMERLPHNGDGQIANKTTRVSLHKRFRYLLQPHSLRLQAVSCVLACPLHPDISTITKVGVRCLCLPESHSLQYRKRLSYETKTLCSSRKYVSGSAALQYYVGVPQFC